MPVVRSENEAIMHIKLMFNKHKALSIQPFRKRRSLSQNAYFHGVVVVIYADTFGLFSDEAKQELKGMFLKYIKESNGREYVKSTADLNTLEFEQFLTKCRTHASQNGCFIPLPNEVTPEMDIELERIKGYI